MFDRFLSHSLPSASSINKHILTTQVLGDAEIEENYITHLGGVHGLCPPEAHSLLCNQAHFTHSACRKSRQASWRSWPESTCSHMGTHCSVCSVYWLTNLSYPRMEMCKAWCVRTDRQMRLRVPRNKENKTHQDRRRSIEKAKVPPPPISETGSIIYLIIPQLI